MPSINEQDIFRPSVYQLETTDYAFGGAPVLDQNGNNDPTPGQTPGLANAQAKQLADRTLWLRNRFILGGSGGVPRNTMISGWVNGSGVARWFDTSGNNVQLLGSTEPAVLSFASGFDAAGIRERYVELQSDLSLDCSALPDGAYAVYAEYDPNTNLVQLVTSDQIVPETFGPSVESADPNVIYAPFGGIAPDTYWYNLNTQKMLRWQGSPLAWVSVEAVHLGVITVASGVPTLVYTRPLRESYDTSFVPTGTVHAYADNVISANNGGVPFGWLVCNGAAVQRVRYRRLFDVIGTAFGAGDGSTTFNIPDLRGEFVRGWDAGRGVDTGRVFGSSQAYPVQSGSGTDVNNVALAYLIKF
jgi:hypothetical protein